MEKFTYNPQALIDIMSKHRLSKRDVLNVLGTKDYSSLTRWMENENPVPIDSMLKLCNKFNVSPAEWFLQNGETGGMTVKENTAPAVNCGNGMVSENELLRIQLAHAQEINEIERAARTREDAIRRECQINFDKERSRLMDLIERLNNEVLKNNKGFTGNGYRVAEEEPTP